MSATHPRERLAYVRTVPLLAAALHAVWWIAQSSTFRLYADQAGGVLHAAFGGAAATALAYLATAASCRSWRWPHHAWRGGHWLVLLGTAYGLAAATELYGLAAGGWSYAAAVPTLPGSPVSPIPLLQTLTITPLSVALAERVVHPERRRAPVGSATVARTRQVPEVPSHALIARELRTLREAGGR